MQVIIFLFSLIIILVNLLINLANLTKIAQYCIAENSLNDYWSTYTKVGVSGKAIFSTIIGFFFATLLFFILIPYIGINSYLNKEKIQKALNDGLIFKYHEMTPGNTQTGEAFHNMELLGYETTYTLTGKPEVDFSAVVRLLKTKSEGMGKPFSFDILERIKLDGRIAIVPVLVNIEGIDYPLYMIYNTTQATQFERVKQYYAKAGINDVLYFSALPIETKNPVS